MAARPQKLQELDHMFDIFIETETPRFNRHVACVMPVRDVNVMVLKQRFRRVAQQSGKMARHWGDEQNLGLWAISSFPEMDQTGERRVEHDFIRDTDRLVADR